MIHNFIQKKNKWHVNVASFKDKGFQSNYSYSILQLLGEWYNEIQYELEWKCMLF